MALGKNTNTNLSMLFAIELEKSISKTPIKKNIFIQKLLLNSSTGHDNTMIEEHNNGNAKVNELPVAPKSAVLK